jgi:hypothetical protein
MKSLKVEWLLASGVTLLTLFAGLVIIRRLAPRWLGIPIDLQMVQTSRTIPPFFETVFREEDLTSSEFLLKEPYTNVRSRPLIGNLLKLGPHDLLGFRNDHIPNLADVITFGDSQTYGNNTTLDDTWPNQIGALLKRKHPEVYNMANNGWTAVQYLYLFPFTRAFRPRVVVIAYYSGNDPDEAVTMAYSDSRWASLRPSGTLNIKHRPHYPGIPPPPSENWVARFHSGTEMTFTPTLRLISNDTSYPTVQAGYHILEESALRMEKMAEQAGIGLILTVLPTKELVYANRVKHEKLIPTSDYLKLVTMEQGNVQGLVVNFRHLKYAHYVDVVKPLQEAAMSNDGLYPQETDGHPLAPGNKIIAAALAPAIDHYLATPPRGIVGMFLHDQAPEKHFYLFLVTDAGRWKFANKNIAERNGWRPEQVQWVTERDLLPIHMKGLISTVDPQRFGPAAVSSGP